MKKCFIVGGAPISNYNRIIEGLKKRGEDYYTVFCDSGLKHMEALGLKPDLIVGDFDSHENPNLPVETIVLPTEKDDTDTVFAVKEAVKRGYKEFVLIGTIGGRLDHSLGNIAILTWLESQGLKGIIFDDFSQMEMISNREYKERPYIITDEYKFFSLVNITGEAKGVTIRNAKYNLDRAEINCEYAYGVSNEPVKGKNAEITIECGRLLVIKDFE